MKELLIFVLITSAIIVILFKSSFFLNRLITVDCNDKMLFDSISFIERELAKVNNKEFVYYEQYDEIHFDGNCINCSDEDKDKNLKYIESMNYLVKNNIDAITYFNGLNIFTYRYKWHSGLDFYEVTYLINPENGESINWDESDFYVVRKSDCFYLFSGGS